MTDIYFHPVVYLVVSFNHYGLVNGCVGLLALFPANEALLHKQTTEDTLSKGRRKGIWKRKKMNNTSGIKQLVSATSQRQK